MCQIFVGSVHNFSRSDGDINTSYLTDSYISFTLKLESPQIFCSNRSIRSSMYGEMNISDFPPCRKMVIFITQN